METKKMNGNDNFQNFMQLQKEIIESFQIGTTTTCTSVLQIDELFEFLNRHIVTEFHQKENFRIALRLVHRSIKVWISREDYLKDDVGIVLTYLIADHYMHEENVNIALQIIYQFMNSIKIFGNNDVPISEKLLRELIAIMPSIKSRVSASNCITCIQKYLEMFPESWRNLGTLWSNLKHQIETNLTSGIINEIDIDILIQFIDNFKSLQSNFHDEPILISVIQHLLKSDQRKSRKCGFYLLQKLIDYFMDNVSNVNKMWMSLDHNQQLEKSWIMYITILKNLEEEQSHLILPSVEHLKELVNSKHLPSSWLNILYVRILTHNNNVVLRWSIEFFLRFFSCSNLCEEILQHLLQATNSNALFNYEGYFLGTYYFSTFLVGDTSRLLRLLCKIENWKSIPLYIWLENINKMQSMPSLTFEEVLKISSCIRKLQNCIIRKRSIQLCQEIFKGFIEKMTMKEYVMYIETLYNTGDNYDEHKVFYSKKSSLLESESDECIYKQRFYEIFANSNCMKSDLLSFLKDVPVEQHGWLKFAVFNFKLNKEDKHCLGNLYKMDLNNSFLTIYEIIDIFKGNLCDLSLPLDKYELMECKTAAISFYIHEKDVLHNENEDTLHFILHSEVKVIIAFTRKILENNERKFNLCFIKKILQYKYREVYKIVGSYLTKFCDKNFIRKHISMLKELYKECYDMPINMYNHNKYSIVLHSLIDDWIKKLPSQGDKRIEEAFSFHHFDCTTHCIPDYYLKSIQHCTNDTFLLHLLKCHIDITKKKPRYFENSHEHRAKLRIAICVYNLTLRMQRMSPIILEKIWNILLDENNQLNIIYIYESILGLVENRENVIINKLREAQNLTSSQKLSIISVAYNFFKGLSPPMEIQNKVVNTLLSLSMGPNFQTRLLAQMFLYKLLETNFKKIEGRNLIIQSIEDASGTKLEEYLSDVRIVLSELLFENVMETVLYITNAPFDETLPLWKDNLNDLSYDHLQKLECLRKRHLNKFNDKKDEDIPSSDAINYQIQRKMNPVNNLTEPHNLIAYPIEEKTAEMVVVASLIDKLPNLGGIARTCEVLGIKNLVLSSKMCTEKPDFKNLSMTAEKTLNIFEVKRKDLGDFLISKKLEGFTIVGAEQTCNSQHFENFQFPEKCVLLLGHEKDGIPAPILGLLDETVEVPQFGQVRSLNVHVTGALFMWEYCKQHLVQN